MRCPDDHMLKSRRSFLFTFEHVNIRIKELLYFEHASSFVIAKNIRKITKL